MDLQQLQKEALRIREKYAQLETKKYGKEWTTAQLAEGFAGDVRDLLLIVSNREGDTQFDEKVKHELADCLWSVLVLAKKFDVNLEEAFMKTMKELEERIDKDL